MLFRKNYDADNAMELNTTSTADISFILLIFFLVTTSMDRNFGLMRQLPKAVPEEMEKTEKTIDRRNVCEINVGNGAILANSEKIESDKLCAQLKEFIMNPEHNPNLAESPEKHLIVVHTDGDATYDDYFKVENQIVNAYNELRQTEAQKRFGKDYRMLTERQMKSINLAIPQMVSEPGW